MGGAVLAGLTGALMAAGVLARASGAAASGPQVFRLEQGTVRLEVPAGWQAPRDFFGMPLTLMAPDVPGIEHRTVVGVIPTGVPFPGDPSALERQRRGYEKEIREWAASADAKVLEFLPGETLRPSAKVSAYAVGVRYEQDGQKFTERTYYFSCGGKLFHLKAILDSRNESRHQKQVDAAVRSFACG